ncbi:hypothetical protein [Aquimarina intermedia]|uniref:NinB protein n=1 Tax=Aquimarina intermedia TaxID=350814 RepID=A0A5S5BWV6_9FLAO|nr:hypothetical protein [Aquimarina intermedia]TYP71517.1 hypothetical protein BD809_10999 [Aquimarina intermedia]
MPKNPRKIEVETSVLNGKLIKNRDFIIEGIEAFEGKDITLILQRIFKKRSNRQNNYYFGVIVEHWKNLLREEWGEILSPDEVHEFLKVNLSYEDLADEETGEIMLNPITGNPIRKTKSTTKNSTWTQEEYHKACRDLAWNMFEYQIPLPDPEKRVKF